MIGDIIVALLAVLGIFLCLMPHKTHCELLGKMMKCPPHWVLILLGVLCFLGATLVAQWTYITTSIKTCLKSLNK